MDSAPRIIIGMGSSGTRLLVTLLEHFGIFMGGSLINNDFKEASMFHSGAHAFVDLFRYHDPLPMDWHRIVSTNMPALRMFIHDALPTAFEAAGYSGGPWGFKDPRTTFVLNAYLDRYPESVVLHCVRDGRDVALTKISERWPSLRDSHRVDRWLRVWENNVSTANAWKSHVRSGRFHVVRYEDMCRSTDNAISVLVDVAGCKATDARRAIGRLSRTDRLEKWRSFPQLFSSLESTAALKQFGYPT